MSTPLLYKAFKLPWQENDNPNGWIEPTNYCQITCPGCYRGIDKNEHSPKHEDLKMLKKQVDWFIKERNVQTISIAGGEPLLYPHIFDLINYIYSKGLRTMLYTNGVALTKEILKKLKEAGVNQVLMHIDRFQQRDDLRNPKAINDLKQKFCEMFREVKGINLGFIQPISADYITEIDRINDFANQNIDIVNLIVYALYQEICWNEETKSEINTSLNINDVIYYLKDLDGFIPGAYLPSENNKDEYTWVFGIKIGIPNLKLGYFSPTLYKLIQQKYRRKNGRYLFISRHHKISPFKLIKFIWIKGLFSYLTGYFKARASQKTNFKNIYLQTTLILRGPIKKNDTWDLCSSCPDRMIYNNKLVPSCILEDLKKSEKISDFKTANMSL